MYKTTRISKPEIMKEYFSRGAWMIESTLEGTCIGDHIGKICAESTMTRSEVEERRKSGRVSIWSVVRVFFPREVEDAL